MSVKSAPWWLRTPCWQSFAASNVNYGGTISFSSTKVNDTDCGVRPACCLTTLKSDTTITNSLFSNVIIDKTNDFSCKNDEANYTLQHVSFVDYPLYKDSVKNDLRFAKTLWNTCHNGGGKEAAEFAYDIMEGIFQTITLDFDYKALKNPYDLILLKLLAENSRVELTGELFDVELKSIYAKFFNKFLTLTQADEKWSEADINEAIDDMIKFKEKNLDGNKIIKSFKKNVKNQNVAKLVENIFGNFSYFSDVADTLEKVSTGYEYVIDIFRTVSTIEAYRRSSDEFKTVLLELKKQMNSVDDIHTENFNKSYKMITTDNIVQVVLSKAKEKALFFGADLVGDVAKEGIKFLLKAKGLSAAAISKLSAWLFAYELGFMLGNMITGNDKAVACRRIMRAYYALEGAAYNTLIGFEEQLKWHQNQTNAKIFDEAFNLFKKIQINFLDVHREFYENSNKKIVLKWATVDGANSGSQIEITNKRKELWERINCHLDNPLFGFQVKDVAYTGKDVEPTIIITYGYITLKKGKDYTIKCKNNIKIGNAATAIVTGIGNYQGVKTLNFKIVPSKVTGLKASKQTADSILLTWTKVKQATGYVIYQYDTSKKIFIQIGTSSKNSYMVKSLKAGTKYDFAVKAYTKVEGTKCFGDQSEAISTSTAPATPKIKVDSSVPNKVAITWNWVRGANGYVLYRYNASKKEYTKIKAINTNHYLIKNLKSGATYRYAVRAFIRVSGKNIYSSYSAVKKITVK